MKIFSDSLFSREALSSGDLTRFDAYALKSGLQKYIRRGKSPEAVAVTQALLKKGEVSTLCRRLPNIIVEDCGISKMWLLPILSDIESNKGKMSHGDLLETFSKIAYLLADSPKDKDICGFHDTYWDPHESVDTYAMQEALSNSNWVLACKIACKCLEDRNNAGSHAFWDALTSYAASLSAQSASIIAACRKRASSGCMDFDRRALGAASVLYLSEYPVDDEYKAEFDSLTYPISTIRTLDWYCLDMHTQVGKTALGSLSKKKSIPYQQLESAFWYFASSHIENSRAQRFWKGNEEDCFKTLGMPLSDLKSQWESSWLKDCVGMICQML